MRIKQFTLGLLAGCLALTACNEHVVEVDQRIETTLARAEEYLEASQIPDLPAPTDTVRMQNDIWLGAQSVKIMEGDALPSWVEKDDGVTMAISEKDTLPNILQELSLFYRKFWNAVHINTRRIVYNHRLAFIVCRLNIFHPYSI